MDGEGTCTMRVHVLYLILFDYLVPVSSLEDNFTQPHGHTLHVVSPMVPLLWSNQTLNHISSI